MIEVVDWIAVEGVSRRRNQAWPCSIDVEQDVAQQVCLDPEERLTFTGDTEDAFQGDDGKHWATVFNAIDAADVSPCELRERTVRMETPLSN